ncbi:MAG TPA: DUF3858 domain-containing protein, partial [Bacteroidales bacterium]|nr:DUF3858 domain-containing protein [Bacteroidales bacterium]
LEAEKVANSRKFIFKITDDGGTRVSIIFTFRGAEFEAINNLLMNYSKEDQNEVIHNFLPFNAFDLYDWKMIKNGRDEQYVTLSVSAEINQIVNPIGDQYYFSFQRTGIPEMESPQVRNLPVMLPYPLETYDTITYILPAGKRITEIPEDKLLESKYGKYSVKFANQGETLIIYRHFKLNAQYINAKDYQEFYNFIAFIKSHEKLKILFR